MTGILYVVATPIGNLEDITIRAVKTLLGAPIIVCEDTRRTGQLLKIIKEKYQFLINPIGLKEKSFISVRDFNESRMVGRVLTELETNDVALVSDAGTPLLSDPGFKVVRAARAAGVKVVPITGPFAGAAAICASGLPTNKFLFWGFLPKKYSLAPDITHIIYESPLRAAKTAAKIKAEYPTAKIVAAQELTKIYEKIADFQPGMSFKGEVTLLVHIPSEMRE